MPLASGAFRGGALVAENRAATSEDQAAPAVHVKDAAQDGILVIRMPSPYVYLTGQLSFKAVVGDGGAIRVEFSDNNGLDWREVAKVSASGDQSVDLKSFAYRRYDYRLRFTLKGKGTGLDSLRLAHDVQHSQRPLPALAQGENKIAFSAGNEGTITVEGSVHPGKKPKQLVLGDFHPAVNGMDVKDLPKVAGAKGDLTFSVETPGDLTRLRFGLAGRVHDARDAWSLQVSFDDGQTFKTVDTMKGPARFATKYVTFTDVPAKTRKALVRYAGENVSGATLIFNLRLDADYQEPRGGFAPVKITYVWDENGQEKRDVHVAQQPRETYTITCAGKPVMKSIAVELAE